MSRIGRIPIEIPNGVSVNLTDKLITIKGPKGELNQKLLPNIKVEQKQNMIVLVKSKETAITQRQYGLLRTLIANMINGVSNGYSKQLEINGVGYRATVNGKILNLLLGFSHPINYELPDGLEAKVEKNIITISGFDKQKVGQAAAEIRSFKKPEPYKGKGIKYLQEKIRRKAGKAAITKT